MHLLLQDLLLKAPVEELSVSELRAIVRRSQYGADFDRSKLGRIIQVHTKMTIHVPGLLTVRDVLRCINAGLSTNMLKPSEIAQATKTLYMSRLPSSMQRRVKQELDPTAKDLETTEVLRIAAASGVCTLVRGPVCCGKRTLVQALGKEQGRKLVELAVTADTEEADLLGEVVPKSLDDGRTVFEFISGPLRRAVENGSWVLIANINYARSEVLERLNSLGETPARLHIFELNDAGYTVHNNFRLFCTCSHSGNGKYPLPSPLLFRCALVDISMPSEPTIATGARRILDVWELTDTSLRTLQHAISAKSRGMSTEDVISLCFGDEKLLRDKKKPVNEENFVLHIEAPRRPSLPKPALVTPRIKHNLEHTENGGYRFTKAARSKKSSIEPEATKKKEPGNPREKENNGDTVTTQPIKG